MKIESIIKRDGGSRISLAGANYHFKPDEEGRHVADVEHEDHIERFLAIPEGYRLAPSAASAPVEPVVTTDPPVELTTIAPVTAVVGHGVAARDAIVAETKAEADQNAQEQDAAKADAATAGIGAAEQSSVTQEAPPADDKKPPVDDTEAAKAAYIEKFGKKPHHTWSAELIRQKLAEA